MIIQLNVTNRLDEPIVLNSQSASGQPIAPQQALQATFSVVEDENGVAVITLYVDPQR